MPAFAPVLNPPLPSDDEEPVLLSAVELSSEDSVGEGIEDVIVETVVGLSSPNVASAGVLESSNPALLSPMSPLPSLSFMFNQQ